MEFQSVCLGISAPKLGYFHSRCSIVSRSDVRFTNQRLRLGTPSKRLGRLEKKSSLPNLNRVEIVYCSGSNGKLEQSGRVGSRAPMVRFDAEEPFRGKSGSVSFHGLTHQLVEERKFEKGSFVWILAPVALILSLILPQFFLGDFIEFVLEDSALSEIVSSLVFEVLFYVGLGLFLLVTDHVQRPYLQFSAKRWGLITGLRGYLTSSFFTMGLKVVVPLIACYVNWPLIGFPALAAVVPFLVGYAAQFGFETLLERRGSSVGLLFP